MCGIVGAVAGREVAEILVEGLRRLEYRGYDSAGLAVLTPAGELTRLRRLGKVAELAKALQEEGASGVTGIAHTRWATHGEPSERNAHPHVSNEIVIVHNGIIENHETLREELTAKGYHFSSDTDTEVIAHLLHLMLQSSNSLCEAMQKTAKQLRGAYGTVALDSRDPSRLVVARSGSPLVIGLGEGENFIASDQLALLPVTRRFIFLEEGDVAEVTREQITIFNVEGELVERSEQLSTISHDAGDKGDYDFFMQKEIFEQAAALSQTLEGRLHGDHVLVEAFGNGARAIFEQVEHIQIVACGTSYNSGMVARYWFEALAGVSCDVEIASEFRYRKSVVRPNSLLITLSQSGETADTLAALRLAKESGYMSSLAVCNVPGSSLVRESNLAFMTRAGAEIGVASTKAFTTQLAGLLMLVTAIGRCRALMAKSQEKEIVSALESLPRMMGEALKLNDAIAALAPRFADKAHSMFLGRGEYYPIAMEGALKLKEISYIHAEAYAAGELKHGPLALIDANMPTIVVAPDNDLIDKLKSNIEEVRARGGEIYLFAEAACGFKADATQHLVEMPSVNRYIAPILYTVPMQLLAYHVAQVKGTNVDQPRNLAKSVTVE